MGRQDVESPTVFDAGAIGQFENSKVRKLSKKVQVGDKAARRQVQVDQSGGAINRP